MDIMPISGFIIILLLSQGDLAQAEPEIVISPANKAVLKGGAVEFLCKVQQNPALTEYIQWEECITQDDGICIRISNNNITVYSLLGGDADRETRYSVSNPQTGQYNLNISGVQTEDGGKYRCVSRYKTDKIASTQLTVLDKMSCNPGQNILMKDETINMTCQIGYYGGHWIPVLQWFKNEEPFDSTSTVNLTNKVISVLTIKAAPENNNDVFSVVVTLQESSPPGKGEADNIPDYSDSYQFSPLQVWYSPRNANIQPSKDVYSLGSMIICMADGNPTPEYKWIDTNTSTVIHNGFSLTITENMHEDHVYICHAYNDHGSNNSSLLNIITSDTYAASSTNPDSRNTATPMNTTAPTASPTNPDSSNTATPMNTTEPAALLTMVAIIGIGVGGGVIIFVVVIIIIICVCKKKKHKQTETVETTPSIPMSHQTSVANVYQIDANFENDENNIQERRVDHDGLNNPGLDLQSSYAPTPPMLPRKTYMAEPNEYADNSPYNPNQMKNLEGLTYADLDLLQHIGPHSSRPAEQTGPNASRPTHEVHIENSTTEYADIRMK